MINLCNSEPKNNHEIITKFEKYSNIKTSYQWNTTETLICFNNQTQFLVLLLSFSLILNKFYYNSRIIIYLQKMVLCWLRNHIRWSITFFFNQMCHQVLHLWCMKDDINNTRFFHFLSHYFMHYLCEKVKGWWRKKCHVICVLG